MFGCKHKYGKIEDGYQYCEKCGLARPAPPRECEHKWVKHTEFEGGNILSNHISSHIYVMSCSNCGEIKQVKVPEG